MRTLLLTLLLAAGCGPEREQEPRETSSPDTGGAARPADPCSALWYPDRDGDGYGPTQPGMPACSAPMGWVAVDGDCDDADPLRNPGTAEACNGSDDDCDGEIDEDFEAPQATWYPDADADGWGAEDGALLACGASSGFVELPGDCDDVDADINPASREPRNGVDDDCDGVVDEGFRGLCRDGVKGGAFEACDRNDDAACPGACSAHCACPSADPGPLRVHVVDVGQGDAIVVVSPDGFVMLVDAGPSSACDELYWHLDTHGIHGIDYTLLSHQHTDHHGSMDAVLADHPEVVAAFDNNGAFPDASDVTYRVAAVGRRVPLFAGRFIDMGPQMSIEVLHADEGSSNENDNSVVLLLSYDDVSVLLGGDCEGPCEASFDPGPVDVYKVHHHGASDSSSDALLQSMEPLAALISVGEGNRYDHPDSSTLRALEDVGADLYRTDLDGDILLESDGTSFELNGERYKPVSSLSKE